MAEQLPVPPELEHLIEKREQEEDRRREEHRSGKDQRAVDLGPLGALESSDKLEEVPTEDRRRGEERRQAKDRRQRKRRKKD